MLNKYKGPDFSFWFMVAAAVLIVTLHTGCASAGSTPHIERVAQCARNGGLVVAHSSKGRIQKAPYYVSCH